MDQHEMFMTALRQVAQLCAVAAVTAKTASLNNVDARCQARIAAAARHLGVIEADLAVALSMSVSHKNIFFDKKIPYTNFDDQLPA